MSTTLPDSSQPKLPASSDLKSILEHVRGQFQYHAGQRLNAIRYFFIAYAIFVAAYLGTINGSAPTAPAYVRFIISAIALMIALGFWGLDARNVQMVHIDERALKEIELLVSKEFNLRDFQMADRWDNTPFFFFRYQFIVNILFAVIALVSALATARDFVQTFCRA